MAKGETLVLCGRRARHRRYWERDPHQTLIIVLWPRSLLGSPIMHHKLEILGDESYEEKLTHRPPATSDTLGGRGGFVKSNQCFSLSHIGRAAAVQQWSCKRDIFNLFLFLK